MFHYFLIKTYMKINNLKFDTMEGPNPLVAPLELHCVRIVCFSIINARTLTTELVGVFTRVEVNYFLFPSRTHTYVL